MPKALSTCKKNGLISAGRDESFNKGATADKNVRQYLKHEKHF
jgi:hypothetical protein